MTIPDVSDFMAAHRRRADDERASRRCPKTPADEDGVHLSAVDPSCGAGSRKVESAPRTITPAEG